MALIDELLEYYNNKSIENFMNTFLDGYNVTETKKIQSTLAELYKQLHKIEHNFHPDFNGYFNLVLLVPPHLSAPEYEQIFGKPFETNPNEDQNFFYKTIRSIPILVNNITLPAKNVKISENKLITGSLPVPEEVSTDNQISITYHDDFNQSIYTFHKIWIEYIDDVTKGVVKPNDFYIQNGYVDFTGALFVLKFDVLGRLKKLFYTPMIIPISINPSENINIEGTDVFTISVTYQIYTYEEFDYFELEQRGVTINNPQNHPFLTKLRQFLSYWVKESKDVEESTQNNTQETNKNNANIDVKKEQANSRFLIPPAIYNQSSDFSINNRIENIKRDSIKNNEDKEKINQQVDEMIADSIDSVKKIGSFDSQRINDNTIVINSQTEPTDLVKISNTLNTLNDNYNNLDNKNKENGALLSANVLTSFNHGIAKTIQNMDNDDHIDIKNSDIMFQGNIAVAKKAAEFLSKYNNEQHFTKQENIDNIINALNNLAGTDTDKQTLTKLSENIDKVFNDLTNASI